MAGLRNLIEKYTSIAKELPKQRQDLALIYAHHAHALTANRIQNSGIDARGSKMPLYSDRPFNLGKLNPDDFNAPSKIIKFKKDAAQKKTVLRSFISHIEVEREGDILKGAIYYYIPFDDDIIDDTDDETPPPDKSPSGGNDYVPSPHSPVGAPFRRHIIQKNFVASTKRPRS